MLSLAPEVAAIVRPGVLAFEGVRVVERDPALDEPLAAVERQVRLSPPPEAAEVRSMYRAVGIDPTRRRPSSEALLRRVQRGEPLPRINSLVDISNWCSLEFQLPYGLYDLDQVTPPIALRLGRDGEQYAGIRKDVVHVGGRLTLADAQGPFGNPSSDSARTMVVPGATRVLVVVFAPAAVRQDRLRQVVETTAVRIERFSGGRQTFAAVLTGI